MDEFPAWVDELRQGVRQTEWERLGLTRPMALERSLRYHLNRLPKEELVEIRRRLGLSGLSRLHKAELVAVLEEELPRCVRQQIEALDEVCWDIVRQVVDSRGLALIGAAIEPTVARYLRETGLAYTGYLEGQGLAMVMPTELLEACRPWLKSKEIRDRVSENERLLLTIQGHLTHYGSIRADDLQQILQRLGFDVSAERLLDLGAGLGEATGRFARNSVYLHDFRVLDVERIIAEQGKHPDLDYRRLQLDEAITAGQEFITAWSDEYEALGQYLLDHCGLSDEEAMTAIWALIASVNNDLSAEVVLHQLGHIGVPVRSYDEAAAVLSLIAAMRQQTRLWGLKGHTPGEAQELKQRPRLRIVPPPAKASPSSAVRKR